MDNDDFAHQAVEAVFSIQWTNTVMECLTLTHCRDHNHQHREVAATLSNSHKVMSLGFTSAPTQKLLC
jgi:hypothetical protein